MIIFCYISLNISCFFTLFSDQLYKKESLHTRYTRSYSSQKFYLKFFFLTFFLNSSNLILKFSTLLPVLDLIMRFVPKYITLLATEKNLCAKFVAETFLSA